MNSLPNWIEGLPCALTVCNHEGIVLAMNRRAGETFAKDGGLDMIGKNILNCHPEPARSKLAGMLESGLPNVYTIEKEGVRKLIYQSPWFDNGVYAGFMELSLPLPADMPHFVRS